MSCLTITGRMNPKHRQSVSTWNSPYRLSSLVVTKFWAANVHNGVLVLTQMICLPGQDGGSLGPSHLPAHMGGGTFSLSSLVSGLGVPRGRDPSIVPWLGFVQLST